MGLPCAAGALAVARAAGTITVTIITGAECIVSQFDEQQANAIEAAAFRRLLDHLDSRRDVQNIDLMNLAGFCRNCLSKWYVEAAQEAGLDIDYEAARRYVYRMPYEEWKVRYQAPASPGQLEGFAAGKAGGHV